MSRLYYSNSTGNNFQKLQFFYIYTVLESCKFYLENYIVRKHKGIQGILSVLLPEISSNIG